MQPVLVNVKARGGQTQKLIFFSRRASRSAIGADSQIRVLKWLIVFRNPAVKPILGVHPKLVLARVMSGRLCRGSSLGNGLNVIRLREPVMRITRRANSSTVISSGLPRLTGPTSELIISR